METKVNNAVNDSVDAVFVIGTGSKNNNEELRYALRNIERNCPFIRNIYISGECPNWVNLNFIKHLKWPDRFNHAKDANIIDKLRHACEQPDIAKKILFCSDDQFQTKVCTWDNFNPLWLRKYTPDDTWYTDKHRIWHNRLRATLERDRLRRKEEGLNEAEVYYYQPHMWMQIDRDKFIEYAKWSDYEHREDTIIASGYFNFIDANGIQNTDHIFISPSQTWPVNATHIAYTDSSFTAAMSFLHNEFSKKSRFEIYDEQPVNVTKDYTSNKIGSQVQNNQTSITPTTQYTTEPLTLDEVNKLYKIKKAVSSNKIWGNILKEINEAELMRLSNAPGWKRVWNDIIIRWATATRKGSVIVEVESTTNLEIKRIVKAFIDNHTKKPDSYSRTNVVHTTEKTTATTATTSTNTISRDVIKGNPIQENQTQRSCSRCEARRKRLQELKKLHAEEITGSDISSVKEKIEATKKSDNDGNNTKNKEITKKNEIYINNDDACADCVLEHLSTAVAYLNSNAQRPLNFEVTLAYGEVKVAANHLIALKEDNLYNKCTKILDSYNSEASLFTVPEIKNLLAEASKKLY